MFPQQVIQTGAADIGNAGGFFHIPCGDLYQLLQVVSFYLGIGCLPQILQPGQIIVESDRYILLGRQVGSDGSLGQLHP